MASQPITWSSASKTASGLLKTARTTLTVFGLTAIAIMALLYTNDSFAKRVSEMLHPQPVVVAAAEPVAPVASTPKAVAEAVAVETTHLRDSHAMLGNSKQQQYVTNWLSKRYRVAGDAANMLVSTAYLTAHELKIDPLLILAVMAIESGLNPFAESAMGAKGLMQVMAKVHHDKFEDVGGPQAALNPVANIRVGALILRDYVKRTGSIEGGLKTYVGAANFETDSGYGQKELNEWRLLKKVSKGQNVPVRTPRASPAPATIMTAKQSETGTAKEAKPMQETTTASNTGAQVPNVEPLAGL